jgi:hypothetical protein
MGAPAFVIHGLKHLRAALAAARAAARPVIVISAPAAGAYAGANWFAVLIAHAAAEFPDVEMTAILDCGDRGGDVLAALKAGLRHIVFTGHPDAAARLIAIATVDGARILDRRPPALDLLDSADVDYAARKHCECLPEAKPFGY